MRGVEVGENIKIYCMKNFLIKKYNLVAPWISCH